MPLIYANFFLRNSVLSIGDYNPTNYFSVFLRNSALSAGDFIVIKSVSRS